jgi:hypothetical protein
MNKKNLPVAIALVIGLTGCSLFRHDAIAKGWKAYDGKLASLVAPAGMEVTETHDNVKRVISLDAVTPYGLVFLGIVEHLPGSGVDDVDKIVRESAAQNTGPNPVVVKKTSFGGFPAQEFVMEAAKHVDYAAGAKPQPSYSVQKEIVFKRENGRVCEIIFALPDQEADVAEHMYRQIISSVRLK